MFQFSNIYKTVYNHMYVYTTVTIIYIYTRVLRVYDLILKSPYPSCINAQIIIFPVFHLQCFTFYNKKYNVHNL